VSALASTLPRRTPGPMITQRQIPHAAGELPACARPCSQTPKHYHDSRAPHAGGGHFLECYDCGVRTAGHASLAAAVAEWTDTVGRVPVPTTPRACA
jgi:hypothetical protein